jgi:hypothetical protein
MTSVFKARVAETTGGHRRITVFVAPHPDHTYANVGDLVAAEGDEAADLADLLSRIMPVEFEEAKRW